MKLPSAKLLILFLLPLFFVCCSNDDDTPDYPSAVTELVEAMSDKNRLVTLLHTDRGETLTLDNQPLKTARPDTTYRCLCMYVKTSETAVKVYKIETVFSALPLPTDKYKSHPKSPVHIISAWRSNRYINLYLSYLTIGADKHAFGFCEDQVVTEGDGTTTIYVSLLHQRPETDSEAFTEKLYISLPTYQYAGVYDHIVFTATTDQGDITYRYDLP